MKSTSDKNSNKSSKRKRMRLGKKTNKGYEYGSKINFGQDISSQISKVIKEKEINKAIKGKVKELKKIIKKFSKKEKNLRYYHKIGEELLFLDDKSFKQIATGSILRRIREELPEILPQNIKMPKRNMYFMYWIGHIKENDLSKASWEQWFEITKFPNLYNKPTLLRKILQECRKIKGHETLNKKIKEIIEDYSQAKG